MALAVQLAGGRSGLAFQEGRDPGQLLSIVLRKRRRRNGSRRFTSPRAVVSIEGRRSVALPASLGSGELRPLSKDRRPESHVPCRDPVRRVLGDGDIALHATPTLAAHDDRPRARPHRSGDVCLMSRTSDRTWDGCRSGRWRRSETPPRVEPGSLSRRSRPSSALPPGTARSRRRPARRVKAKRRRR